MVGRSPAVALAVDTHKNAAVSTARARRNIERGRDGARAAKCPTLDFGESAMEVQARRCSACTTSGASALLGSSSGIRRNDTAHLRQLDGCGAAAAQPVSLRP